jgi:hypothetical protein
VSKPTKETSKVTNMHCYSNFTLTQLFRGLKPMQSTQQQQNHARKYNNQKQPTPGVLEQTFIYSFIFEDF